MASEAQEFGVEEPSSGLSWVDRIVLRVERSGLPAPLWYAIGAVASVALFALNDWLALGRPAEAVAPFHLVLALGPVYALALMHYLDASAGRALHRMRPLITPGEAFGVLHRRLTTLPPRPTLLFSGIGMLLGLGAVLLARISLPAAFRPYMAMGAARGFVELWLILSWFVFGALFIHTLHQLRSVSYIYTRHTIIDLDHYEPLFHFSRVSAVTAIGLLLIPYSWYAAVPHLSGERLSQGFGALFAAFAASAFLWPLIGIHNLMVEAKGRALLQNAAAIKSVRRRLLTQVDSGDLAGAGDIHDALEAIHLERQALLHVPTWPWQPGTPRSVAAALALPLIVWLLQWVLERVLGAS